MIETIENWETRAERYARQLESPVVKGPILHLDRKCSVCLVWGYRDDNYCANCGAKFDKEEKKKNV